MKRILYLACTIALYAVCGANVGCGGGGYSADDSAYTRSESGSGDLGYYDTAAVEEEVTVNSETGETVDRTTAVKDTQKIIKTGRMGIDVTNIGTAKAGIDALVTGSGGYYSSENFYESDRTSTYSLSIRVPSANYEKLIASLEGSGYGEVTYKNIDARDVTEEYLDVEGRLANKRSYLERYRELLRRAVTVKEIMEIEEQVRSLEEEIESAEGRLRYLGDQVSYSTLDVALSQQKDYKYVPARSQKFWEKTKRALAEGWDILKYLVLGIITIWPLLLIVAAILVAVRFRRKKRKAKKAEEEKEEAKKPESGK